MKKSLLQTVILLLVAFALSVAVALDGERSDVKLSPEQMELMSILDTAGDGLVSHSEAQRHQELAQRFHVYDRNGDGRLDRAEFARFEVTEQDLKKFKKDKGEDDRQ